MRRTPSHCWNVLRGANRRQAQREFRADWCTVHFDDTTIDVEVKERPAWRNRVRWDEVTAVGLDPKGLLGPGLYLFTTREPNVVWISLDGTGVSALNVELRRRRVPFCPLDELWRELDERLEQQARELMHRDFPRADWPLVEEALESFQGKLAGRTQVAIVRLARGQLENVRTLAAEARRPNADIVMRDIVENMSSPRPAGGDAR